MQVQTLNDSATAPADYTAINPPQTLTFSSGQTSKTFTVAIANNPEQSANRSLRLRLLNATGEPLGEPDQATLTILDKGRAELQLTAFGPPAVGLVGKTIAVPTTVRNGPARTAPPSTLRFVLSRDAIRGNADDVVLGTRSVGALGPGASSSSTTTLTIPAGTAPGALHALRDRRRGQTRCPSRTRGTTWARLRSRWCRTWCARSACPASLTNEGCTSPLRNGRAVVLGSLAVSSQTGASLTGSLTLDLSVDRGIEDDRVLHRHAWTPTVTERHVLLHDQAGLDDRVERNRDRSRARSAAPRSRSMLTGQSASGETCDFTGVAGVAGDSGGVHGLPPRHDGRAARRGGGEFVATPSFPASIGRYRVLFEVAGDTAPFPPPANVLFTGPAGSQLADTSGAEMSQLATNAAAYRSPWVSSPPIAPAGEWTEEYEGYYYDYSDGGPAGREPAGGPGADVRPDERVAHAGRLGLPGGGRHAAGRTPGLHAPDPTPAAGPLRRGAPRLPGARPGDDRPDAEPVRDDSPAWRRCGSSTSTTGRTCTRSAMAGPRPGNCRMVEFSAPSFSAAENVSTGQHHGAPRGRPDRHRHGQLHDEQRNGAGRARTTRTPVSS